MKASFNFDIDFTSTVGHKQTAGALRALANQLDPVKAPTSTDWVPQEPTPEAQRKPPAPEGETQALPQAGPQSKPTPTEVLVPATPIAHGEETVSEAVAHGHTDAYKAAQQAIDVIKETLTVNDVIDAAKRLVAHPKAGGPKAMMSVLSKYGVKALHNGPPDATAKPEQYGPIKRDIEALLAEADKAA